MFGQCAKKEIAKYFKLTTAICAGIPGIDGRETFNCGTEPDVSLKEFSPSLLFDV
jgi:hypothetical protein